MSTSSSYYKYDLCNPFNPEYPKPMMYQNYSMGESLSLTRDLIKSNNFIDSKPDNL